MPRKRKEQPDNYNNAFPTALRKLMVRKGITQNELAGYLQKTRQAISYYCDGSSSPDLETLSKIANYFSVSTDYLLGLTDVETSEADIRSIVQKTGLSELSIQQLIDLNEIRQQLKTNQQIEKILEDEAWLERKHIEAILNSSEADENPEIHVLLAELGLSDWRADRELFIHTAVNKRLETSAKAAAYQETIMLDALNYMIENESQYAVLRTIALYLLVAPNRDRYLRLYSKDGGLNARYIHMEDDLFSNTLLLEVDAQLRQLSKNTVKKFEITAF